MSQAQIVAGNTGDRLRPARPTARRNRRWFAGLLAGAIAGTVLALAAAPTAAQQTEMQVRIVYNLPKDHATGKFFETLATEIAARTAKTSVRLVPQTFPDGQLVNDVQTPDALSLGAVEIGQINLGFMVGPDADLLRIWALPFLYETWEAEWAAEDNAEFRAVFDRQLKKYSIQMLGWAQYGSVELYANKPIATPADIKGLRLRGFGADSTKLLRTLGAAPVTMSSQEVYQGMQRGAIDGYSTGPSSVLDRKLHEVTKFGTSMGLAYIPFVAGASGTWWSTLPADAQKAVIEAAEAAQRIGRESAKTDALRVESDLAAKGMTLHKIVGAERELWTQAAATIKKEYQDKNGATGARMLEIAGEASRRFPAK